MSLNKRSNLRKKCVHAGVAVCGLCGGGCLGSKCYEHTTLPTYACRAGPFSCQLASAKLEKKRASFKQRRMCPGAAVCGLCGGGCLSSKCYEHTTLPHLCLPSRPL